MNKTELVSSDKIKALGDLHIDYPNPGRASSFSLQNHDHILARTNDQMNSWEKAGAELFAPALNYEGGYMQFHLLLRQYQMLSAWLKEIETGQSLADWPQERRQASASERPLPSKEFTRKVCSDVFQAFNPKHAYGKFVQTYLQALADALELGDLIKDPPQKSSSPKIR